MLIRCACNACRYGNWEYHYVGRPAIGYWSGGWGGCGPGYWGNSYYPGMPVPLSVCDWHAALLCSTGAFCAPLWESVLSSRLWTLEWRLGRSWLRNTGETASTQVCRLVFAQWICMVLRMGSSHPLWALTFDMAESNYHPWSCNRVENPHHSLC